MGGTRHHTLGLEEIAWRRVVGLWNPQSEQELAAFLQKATATVEDYGFLCNIQPAWPGCWCLGADAETAALVVRPLNALNAESKVTMTQNTNGRSRFVSTQPA
ncbi:unnamed protein product [Durusdinium trenchii]|uniref:Uncharacterized protein n=2 Tax=Durusdinium trenchii TaxID=1381693 RepID=A0ABP0MII6_9DINO